MGSWEGMEVVWWLFWRRHAVLISRLAGFRGGILERHRMKLVKFSRRIKRWNEYLGSTCVLCLVVTVRQRVPVRTTLDV